MPKFKVYIERHELFMIEVEAESKEAARTEAEAIYTHEEDTSGHLVSSDWSVTSSDAA